jgi:NAD-dependent SIR2 family protein deacetylase
VSKEVFILGAGFSYPAKLPLQAKLLDSLLKDRDLEYLADYENIDEFIEKSFKEYFDLEDIFTILDRAYLNEEHFQQYKWLDIYKIRQSLIRLIINLIDKKLNNNESYENKYEKFINYICENNNDVSIISLNWDTLVEKLVKKNHQDIMIDYCFYTYGIDRSEHIPHINLKARGKDNLKIVKIHGSINWMYCPNCQRVIVDDKNINSIAKDDLKCNYCQEYSNLDIALENFIITPTILKKFDNLHLKYIWNNAFIEMQEAQKITFIGYSLPKADYEFLYLLKKVLFNKEVKIILAPSDKNSEIENRYKNLFENIEFCFDGFENCFRS